MISNSCKVEGDATLHLFEVDAQMPAVLSVALRSMAPIVPTADDRGSFTGGLRRKLEESCDQGQYIWTQPATPGVAFLALEHGKSRGYSIRGDLGVFFAVIGAMCKNDAGVSVSIDVGLAYSPVLFLNFRGGRIDRRGIKSFAQRLRPHECNWIEESGALRLRLWWD